MVTALYRADSVSADNEPRLKGAVHHRYLTQSPERGVTLLEMLVVVTLIAIVAGLSMPSISSGLDSLRLRSASDSIVALLNTSLDRADRRQQAVEILISPRDNAIVARSADQGYSRRVDLTDPVRITSVKTGNDPAENPYSDPNQPRRFLVYPGGAVPRMAIELETTSGHKRTIAIDPITGVPLAR